jgi:hypothetical protein
MIGQSPLLVDEAFRVCANCPRGRPRPFGAALGGGARVTALTPAPLFRHRGGSGAEVRDTAPLYGRRPLVLGGPELRESCRGPARLLGAALRRRKAAGADGTATHGDPTPVARWRGSPPGGGRRHVREPRACFSDSTVRFWKTW